MPSRSLTQLGELLEEARTEVLHISTREAAKRAGISDAHWHHVVVGEQVKKGRRIPVHPSVRNTVAMADAVGVDPMIALPAAGHVGVTAESVSAIRTDLAAARASHLAVTADGEIDPLSAEIQRIERLGNLSVAARQAAIRALINLHAEQAQVEHPWADRADPQAS